MLLIHCPYCGEKREEEEFTYSDEAFITRPLEPENLTDAEWADYVFMRDNLSGTKYENWVHTAGCRKFFIIKRDNLTNAIEKTLKLDDTKTEQAVRNKTPEQQETK